ncbi:MAG: GumC family protein [Ramlibacter sp.]|nr:GumC family protein [Ramlibacter sp.]
MLLALLGSYVVPPRYVAKAEVMVDGRGSQNGPAFSSPLSTEADLLQSERVSIAALRILGLQNDPALRAEWKETVGGRGAFESWAAGTLLKKLDVKPARNSNILTISYSSPDPELAARTVNGFVTAYVETIRELREEGATQSSASFEKRTRNLKASLDLAQARLDDFQKENGISSTDERYDIENLRLSELNAQLVTLQSAAANAAGRQKAAANGSGMQEVLSDPLVSLLGAELARQEARLGELRSRAGSEHPAVADQRAAVDELRARLNAATRRASSAIGAESRIASERAGSVQAALSAQRAKVMEAKSKRDQAQVLQRDLELARRAYDAAVTRSNDSVLDSGASRGNVSVVKAATVPAEPASPRVAVNLAASVVIGLLFAVVVAFWVESRDRRLRLCQDIPELLDQPLLCVLSSETRTATP